MPCCSPRVPFPVVPRGILVQQARLLEDEGGLSVVEGPKNSRAFQMRTLDPVKNPVGRGGLVECFHSVHKALGRITGTA